MYSGISFPAIDPIAFHLGFFEIRWYALSYIFGLILAWFLARKMVSYNKSTITTLKIDDFIVWGTLGILIGGRLGYVFFYNSRYFLEFPIQIFFIWQGGMSFHGGLIGVIVATILFSKKKQIPLLELGDILCCIAPIGLFLGRIANFINGELFGRISHQYPWVIIFPSGGPEPRHPSQLYESFFEGVLLFIILNCIWWFSPKYRARYGFLTGLFFVLYGVFRFFLEFFREPDAHLGFIQSYFTMGQLLSLPMILIGFWIIQLSSPKHLLKKIYKS